MEFFFLSSATVRRQKLAQKTNKEKIMSYIFVIISVAVVLFIIFYIVSFLRVIIYEKKILKYKKRINSLPKEIKKRTDGMPVNQQQFEKLVEIEQKPLLQELEIIETKRQFILDKLPFIKK